MKNQWHLSLCLALPLLANSVPSLADGRESYGMDKWAAQPAPGVEPAGNPRYAASCGSCHFPYQPGLLPAQSWERLMGDLSKHFGDNAELPPEELNSIRNYLLNNAAGRTNSAVSAEMLSSLPPGEPPLRISELPYFVKEHAKVDAQGVKDNPEIRSFSSCNVCHTRAAEGSYSEGEVHIPTARHKAEKPL